MMFKMASLMKTTTLFMKHGKNLILTVHNTSNVNIYLNFWMCWSRPCKFERPTSIKSSLWMSPLSLSLIHEVGKSMKIPSSVRIY